MNRSQADKCADFQALHASEGAFIIPNPWDAGTARLLQGLGFKALATTSAGFAFSLARADGQPTLEEKLAHCRAITAATDIPVNVDFEDGFAADPETVAANVTRLLDTGIAGCSIEDFNRQRQSLYEFDLAVERVAAAKAAIEASGMPVLLTARCENLLRGVQDRDDTIARLQAFEAAGADVLYAPGITSLDDLATVTGAVSKPFNVLGVMIPGATLADFAAAGAKRVSVGSALTWAALKPVLDAGRAMIDEGDFSWISALASGRDIAALMQD